MGHPAAIWLRGIYFCGIVRGSVLYIYIVPYYDLAGAFIYIAGHVNVFVESIITTFRVYGT